jgi:tripartite-type tricarboxylate transporter receptor subunit TctC
MTTTGFGAPNAPMRTLIAVLIGALLSVATATAQQPWPSKPIRILTAASAGSAVDLRARLYAQKLAESLGQPVIVENRPGASGVIAGEALVKAPPDGYTLLMSSGSEVIFNSLLNDALRYDPLRDFAPIAVPISGYLLLGVNADLGAGSVAELVRLAKSKPRQIHCGTSGQATPSSYACSYLARVTQMELGNVPYKGTAQMVLALATGEIQVGMAVTFDLMPHIRAGKVRPLAVLGPQRLHSTPELPTIAEAGYPGLDMSVWALAAAPAGTPEPILRRLNAEFTKAAKQPDVHQSITATGGFSPGYSLEEVAAFVRDEHARWKKVVSETGIKAN